jgi:hypothetical protein
MPMIRSRTCPFCRHYTELLTCWLLIGSFYVKHVIKSVEVCRPPSLTQSTLAMSVLALSHPNNLLDLLSSPLVPEAQEILTNNLSDATDEQSGASPLSPHKPPRDPHQLPSFNSSLPPEDVLYLPPLLSSLPSSLSLADTATRLPSIDPASLSLHKALHKFRAVTPDYASLPYADAFNWKQLQLDVQLEREWYCVVFRSKRRPGSDSGRKSAVLSLASTH